MNEFYPDIAKNVLAVWILWPIVWYMIKENTKRTETLILDKFDRLFKTVKNTTLAEEQTIQLLKDRMLIVSIKEKIPFLKSILEFNHIEWRQEQIKSKIATALQNYSDKYLANFKTYNTPVGDLSEWLEKNFTEKDFNKLVDDIVFIIYRQDEGNKQQIIENKTWEMLICMEVLQAWLVNKLRKDLISKRI